MKTILLVTLFALLAAPFSKSIDQPGSAKNDLKLYTRDDGLHGHSFVNWHLTNQSPNRRIISTISFRTDPPYPSQWKQTVVLEKNQDKIISACKYEGSTNSVFASIEGAYYDY